MTKAMTKADPYLHHRDEVAAIIGDEQYLFDSVEEALTLYRPAWEDEALGKRLAEDRELSRLLLSQKIKERAKVRRNVVKAANSGNDKAAKLALNTLSETTEWAKLNGKPWGSLALLGDGTDDAPNAAAPKVFIKYFFVNTQTGEKSGEMLTLVTLTEDAAAGE